MWIETDKFVVSPKTDSGTCTGITIVRKPNEGDYAGASIPADEMELMVKLVAAYADELIKPMKKEINHEQATPPTEGSA